MSMRLTKGYSVRPALLCQHGHEKNATTITQHVYMNKN